jgi:hypothetical protein
MGTPNDIAKGVVYLASDAAASTTGAGPPAGPQLRVRTESYRQSCGGLCVTKGEL